MDWLAVFSILLFALSVSSEGSTAARKKIRIHIPQKVKHIHHHKKVYITQHMAQPTAFVPQYASAEQYAPGYLGPNELSGSMGQTIAFLPLAEGRKSTPGSSPAPNIQPLYRARGHYGPPVSQPTKAVIEVKPAKKVKVIKLSEGKKRMILRKKPTRIIINTSPPREPPKENPESSSYHNEFYSDTKPSSNTVKTVRKPKRVEKYVDGDGEHIHTYSEEHIHQVVYDEPTGSQDSNVPSTLLPLDMALHQAVHPSQAIQPPIVPPIYPQVLSQLAVQSAAASQLPLNSYLDLPSLGAVGTMGSMGTPPHMEYMQYNPHEVTHDHIIHDHGEMAQPEIKVPELPKIYGIPNIKVNPSYDPKDIPVYKGKWVSQDDTDSDYPPFLGKWKPQDTKSTDYPPKGKWGLHGSKDSDDGYKGKWGSHHTKESDHPLYKGKWTSQDAKESDHNYHRIKLNSPDMKELEQVYKKVKWNVDDMKEFVNSYKKPKWNTEDTSESYKRPKFSAYDSKDFEDSPKRPKFHTHDTKEFEETFKRPKFNPYISKEFEDLYKRPKFTQHDTKDFEESSFKRPKFPIHDIKNFDDSHKRPKYPFLDTKDFEDSHKRPKFPIHDTKDFDDSFKRPKYPIHDHKDFDDSFKKPKYPIHDHKDYDDSFKKPKYPIHDHKDFDDSFKRPKFPVHDTKDFDDSFKRPKFPHLDAKDFDDSFKRPKYPHRDTKDFEDSYKRPKFNIRDTKDVDDTYKKPKYTSIHDTKDFSDSHKRPKWNTQDAKGSDAVSDFAYYESLYPKNPNHNHKPKVPKKKPSLDESLIPDFDDSYSEPIKPHFKSKPKNKPQSPYGGPGKGGPLKSLRQHHHHKVAENKPYSTAPTFYENHSYYDETSPPKKYINHYTKIYDSTKPKILETYASASTDYKKEADPTIAWVNKKKNSKKSISTQNISFGGQEHQMTINHETSMAVGGLSESRSADSDIQESSPAPATIAITYSPLDFYNSVVMQASDGPSSIPDATNTNFRIVAPPNMNEGESKVSIVEIPKPSTTTQQSTTTQPTTTPAPITKSVKKPKKKVGDKKQKPRQEQQQEQQQVQRQVQQQQVQKQQVQQQVQRQVQHHPEPTSRPKEAKMARGKFKYGDRLNERYDYEYEDFIFI